MVTQFGRGQKSQLSAITLGTDLYIGVQVNAPGDWDISCFGLDASDRLSDDSYFIFFNQPKSPEGSIQLLGAQAGDTQSFRVSLDNVPPSINRLSFCAAVDGAGSASAIASGYLRLVAGGTEVMRYPFTGADFTTERAVIIADVYRKGVWRVAAIGQGFQGGLAELIQSYGGDVAGEAAPPAPEAPIGFAPPPSAAPPPAPAPGFGAPTQSYPPAGPGNTAPAYGSPSAMTAPQAPPMHGQPPPGFGQPPSPPGIPPSGFGQPAPGYAQSQPGYPATAPSAAPPPGFTPTEALPSQVLPTQPGAMNSLSLYKEKPTGGRWTQQNSKLVKVTLGPDALALRGSMVAYQGDVEFDYKSGGIRGLIEQKLTGQGLKLMTCKGSGEVFLAQDASDLHIVPLAQGQSICVNAKNLLAMDATVSTEIQRIESAGIPGGGFFHFEVSGPGSVVVMTKGTPMTLGVQGPTFADMNALVAWSTGMRVSVSTQVRISRQIYAGSSGEAFALQFMGFAGHFVVVQPYEV